MRGHPVQANERGVALVVALLVLVALSAIAMTMVNTIMSDRKLGGYDLLAARALNNAEAGVAEAMERIRVFDVPSTENPKSVTQVFLTQPGDVPTKGVDTTALATAQPTGSWISYTTAKPGPDVLTIEYKTNADRTKIYRYNSKNNPAINTTSGTPIFVVTATGTAGGARRRIVTEVVSPTIQPNLKGAIATFKDKLEIKDKTHAYGYDYRDDTPTGTGSGGARVPAWETGTAPVAGGYSRKDVKVGSGTVLGTPNTSPNQPVPYGGPWDVIGMSQAQFLGWIGDPDDDKKQGVPRGLTYLDRDPKKDDEDHEMTGGFNGDGILYVHGDLEIKGDFTFRGLIYVTGEFKIHGNAWILGAVVAAKTHLHPKSGGTITILRSDASVRNNLSKYGGKFVTLTWREVDTTPVPTTLATQ